QTHDFFFQAEDGIRDRNVTGVQTCALPISRSVHINATETLNQTHITTVVFNLSSSVPEISTSPELNATQTPSMPNISTLAFTARSEERRVGKECRYRGARYEYRIRIRVRAG